MQSMRSTVHCATRTRVGEVLSLCRDAVDVFYCLSWLGYQDSHWRHLIPLQRCSLMRSTVHCATRTRVGGVLSLCRDAVDVFYCLRWPGYQDSHWRHLIPLQRCSLMRSTVHCATRTRVGGVLSLCRDAVGVFYSSSRRGHKDTCWGSFILLLICSRSVLQSKATVPLGHALGECYLSAEMQSVCSTAQVDWTTMTRVGRVLSLCWYAVGVCNSLCASRWTLACLRMLPTNVLFAIHINIYDEQSRGLSIRVGICRLPHTCKFKGLILKCALQ